MIKFITSLFLCFFIVPVCMGNGVLPDDDYTIAHYIFNEWSGSQTLNTAPNHVSSATLVSGPVHIIGPHGAALSFDNVAEPHIDINSANFPTGTQARTYMIISRMYNSAGHADTIFAFGGAGVGGSDYTYLQTGLNEVLIVTYAGSNKVETYSQSTITDGEWVFLVITYSGGDPGIERAFRDGVQVGSATVTGTNIGTSGKAAIGYLPTGPGNYCSCDIKEVLISTRAYSEGEIRNIYFKYWGNHAKDN